MERVKVESSQVSSIGYQDGILEVEFNTGSIYEYRNVPQEHFKNLLNCDSVGKLFGSLIKNVYEFRKIQEPKSKGSIILDEIVSPWVTPPVGIKKENAFL